MKRIDVEFSPDGRTLTVRVPLAFRRPAGRKRVETPDGTAWNPTPRELDDPFVRALVRGFWLKAKLDAGLDGVAAARAAGIAPTSIHRYLRLTLLAPDLIEAALRGDQLRASDLARGLGTLPHDWTDQRALLMP